MKHVHVKYHLKKHFFIVLDIDKSSYNFCSKESSDKCVRDINVCLRSSFDEEWQYA